VSTRTVKNIRDEGLKINEAGKQTG